MGKKIAIVLGAGFAIVVAGLAYIWISGGSGDPSTDVGAVAVTLAPVEQPEESTAEVTAPANVALYDIVAGESSVQFEIDEVLDGSPKHVVGTTTEVGGQVRIDFDDPSNTELGTTTINVRTLETDSEFRNRAIRGSILDTNDVANEFAEFVPTAVEGLPASVAVGDVVRLTVTGDFTLSGTTNSEVFAIEVTIVSEDRIEITGSAMVLRSDYGLTIPSVAHIAGVTDEVLLIIDLVAVSA